jgi:carbamoyltransferase
MNVISIYGSHDSSICLFDGKNYRILELEKFNSKRNCSFSKRVNSDPKATDEELLEYYQYIKNTFGIDKIDKVLYSEMHLEDHELLNKVFDVKSYNLYDHHLAHAATAFYQSPYEEALIVSFDGGGMNLDGTFSYFNAYVANRENISHYGNIDANICTPYEKLGTPIKEIRKSSNHLSYAGKMMGLASYGKYNGKIKNSMLDYYATHDFVYLYNSGVEKINTVDGIETQESYDLAYMSQLVFQEIFERAFLQILNRFPNLPICFTGGGALNVLNNQIWYEKLNGNLFVPPNPNDCGLPFGALSYYYNPQEPVDITYAGFDILDREKICGTEVSLEFVAKKLKEGNIIGSIIGNGEIGPRALGNRSILCDPSFPLMKDILNAKVKFREWFRPFAPVVRLEDVEKYFNFKGESKFMNFCPTIKAEYENTLSAIVHQDKTCRVQTITQNQNRYLYDLLTEFEKLGSHPVLLNTSFNIKGKSIINKIEDALTILKTTDLDAVLIEGKYYVEK